MIEVEAKIKIPAPEKFRKLARGIGRLIEEEKKIDDYYTLSPKGKYPKKSLRVRKKNAHYEINFKQKLSYIKGIHAKDEREFQVTDINNFIKLIEDFGFRKWLTKIKDSEVYEIKKNFHLEINHVKNLGWFIEIEFLATEKEIPKARKEILQVIKKLGLSQRQVIKDGYTKMLWDNGFGR